MKTLAILILCLASIALADDFKTIEGKEYKNAKVSRVEPDGIVLITSSGISKIYFTELSPGVQKKYGYNPDAAVDFQRQAYEAGVARAQQISRAQQKQAEERERYWSDTRIKRQQEAEILQQQQQAEQPGAEQQQIIDRQNEILFRLGKVQRPGMSVVVPPPKDQAALWKEYLQLQMSRGDISEQARQQASDELAAMEQEEKAERMRKARAAANQAETDAQIAESRARERIQDLQRQVNDVKRDERYEYNKAASEKGNRATYGVEEAADRKIQDLQRKIDDARRDQGYWQSQPQ